MSKNKPRFLFGDIVVVENELIGVVVKTWEETNLKGVVVPCKGYQYEVYVRSYNKIIDYDEDEIDRYRVRHKELNEEELMYQNM